MYSDAPPLIWNQLEFRTRFRSIARMHQGVSISVFDAADADRQILRFDAYDDAAHYHYDPDGRNKRYWLDSALGINALEWSLGMIARSLPAMAAGAGTRRPVKVPSAAFIKELDEIARQVDRTERQTLKHKPGDHFVDCNNLTFGVLYDAQERGITIRVLRRSGGELEELIGFDCYQTGPHYHYGPRHKNAVIAIDPAVVDDPLEWVFEQLRSGRLPEMLRRAGYRDMARDVNLDELSHVVETVVRPITQRLIAQQAGRDAIPAGVDHE